MGQNSLARPRAVAKTKYVARVLRKNLMFWWISKQSLPMSAIRPLSKIFLHSDNFPDPIFSSNMFWYFCCKTRYYLLLRLSKWLLYSQINLVFHWLLARVNEGNMIMLSVLITFWEIKSSCETLFAAVCEDDTETHLVLPNEPRHRTILNFFVPDVSILNLLNLLKARLWVGELIKTCINTIRILGPVMGVKKSNWLAPGMCWVIIITSGLWLADSVQSGVLIG